jgi:hypothetical protein
MNPVLAFVSRLLRSILRLSLVLLGLLFVAALLCIGLSAALLTVLWSLLTGRKPQAWTTFTRFRQAAQPFQQWARPGAPGQPARGDDIVDVQAHEVPSSRIDHR